MFWLNMILFKEKPMHEQVRHEMVLESTDVSGEEEWNCPTCGRRILIRWEPKFKGTVLKTGDEYASHSGGKGGLQMGSMQVTPTVNLISENDPSLAPWTRWINEDGFENLWNND